MVMLLTTLLVILSTKPLMVLFTMLTFMLFTWLIVIMFVLPTVMLFTMLTFFVHKDVDFVHHVYNDIPSTN